MGLADRPSEQAQAPHWFDLEADGNLVVFGGGGAGKTTALRSLAVSLATSHDAGELHIYVLDFATRGLAGLAALPHVGAIVPGTDVERVQRLLTMLEEELAARREAFAGTGASTLSEHARIAGAAPPRIVVLLDGLPAFNALFDAVDFGQWIERLHRLASEGRALGLHWLLTTDRRTAVYGALSSAVGARLVLRMPDDDDYAALGLDPKDARSALRSPGRGFAGTGLELQVPIVGPDPASDAQNAAIEQLAAGLPVPGPGRGPRPVLSLPDEVRSDALPVAHRLSAAVGLRHDDLRPHCVSVADGNLLVAGPVRSGRSTTLVTIVRGLKASTPEAVFHLIAPRKSPLTSLGLWASTASTASECDDLAARLDDDVAARDGSEPPVVIVVDDAGELEDTDADISLERIARRGRDVGVHVVASAEITQARRSYSGILAQLRKDRSGLLLQPDPDLDGELLGALIPRSNSLRWVEGRGAAVDRGKVAIVQVAVTGEQ